MNRNFLFILALVTVGFGGASYMVYSRTSAAQQRSDEALSLEKVRNSYLEKVGWIRSNPDEAGYDGEVNAFLKAYFDDVNQHLARYGDDTGLYLTQLEMHSGVKDYALRKAAYDEVKETYDLLKSGHYKPVFTGTDKGMRLDVVSDDASGGKIRLALLLWGAQRELHEQAIDQGLGHILKMDTSAAFATHFKLTNAKGKLLYEMDGQDPAEKIDFPERYIPEFPPQMVFGHYDLDQVPYNADKMEITFTVSSNAASGGQITGTYVWKLDVPPDWKLPKGASWAGATETTMDPSEIEPAAHRH